MSLAIYVALTAVVIATMLLSYVLGERSSDHARNAPYESGIMAFGSPRIRFYNHYFLFAVLFVVFDLESVFLYLWSSSVRQIGWPGFLQMLFFVSILILALLYAVRAQLFNLLPKAKQREDYD